MNALASRLLLASVAVLSLSVVAPARAQDQGSQDDSAMQQLKDVEHSSQDAAHADSDEEAKDKSNQGFDTPNNDPAPPAEPPSSDNSDSPGSDPN